MKQVTLDELCSDVAETLNAYAAIAVNEIVYGYIGKVRTFPKTMTPEILEEHYAKTRRVADYVRDSMTEERKYDTDFRPDETVLSQMDMIRSLERALQGLNREATPCPSLPDGSKAFYIHLHDGPTRMGPNAVHLQEILQRMREGLQNYFAEEYGVDLRVLAMRQSFR